jgi:hypothetical protein
MGGDVIQIQLTPEERSLILRHGYPFADIRQAVEAREQSPHIETVAVKRFELEQLIGQLCISINDLDGGRLQDQILDLCDRLEAIERSGDGLLDSF